MSPPHFSQIPASAEMHKENPMNKSFVKALLNYDNRSKPTTSPQRISLKGGIGKRKIKKMSPIKMIVKRKNSASWKNTLFRLSPA
jgi:hypothetical protein